MCTLLVFLMMLVERMQNAMAARWLKDERVPGALCWCWRVGGGLGVGSRG